jgi:hypothetical protein
LKKENKWLIAESPKMEKIFFFLIQKKLLKVGKTDLDENQKAF